MAHIQDSDNLLFPVFINLTENVATNIGLENNSTQLSSLETQSSNLSRTHQHNLENISDTHKNKIDSTKKRCY